MVGLFFVFPVLDCAAADTTYYICPPAIPGIPSHTGTKMINSADNPMPYNAPDLADIIVNNPKEPGGNGVEVIFTPKVYQAPDNYTYRIEALAVYNIPGSRVLTMRSDNSNNPITLQLLPPTETPASFFNPPDWGRWFVILSENPAQKTTTVNIRDLVLDANWPEWLRTSATAANATSPAYTGGFALHGLQVTAAQGTIEKIVIKNCGANGITPCPYWITQGRETFPLMVIASRPTVNNDWTTTVENPPWKIQDCEVYPLHGTHGGYCTSIQVKTPMIASDNNYASQMDLHSAHRVAVVQRCQIHGSGIESGMGSVSSFGVTYRDNMLVGVGLGLNQDTGCQRNISIENNCFLDVYGMAHVGGPNWASSSYQHYDIHDNLIRLRGVGSYHAYGDFRYATVTRGTFSAIQPFTDPTLAIGRTVFPPCDGLWLGGASDVYFNNNRFTTRPRSVFYEPEPSQTGNAFWRAVNADDSDSWTTMPRYFGAPLNYDNNRRSANNMGFWSLATIDNPTSTISTTESPFATGFTAGGTVGRVTPDSSASGGRLKGIREVCISEPTISGDSVTVKACTLYHPTSLDTGNTQTVIEPPANAVDSLQLVLIGADGSITTPSYAINDAANIRSFLFTLSGAVNQYYRAVVFRKPASSNGFQEGAVAWSSAEIHKGTTIRFDQAQDVADDRQLKPGYIRLRRGGTGTASFQFTLRALLRQGSTNARCAAPSGSEADYELKLSDNTVVTCNANGQWTLNFPQNATTMDLKVQPLSGSGDVMEYEAAQFVLDFSPSFQGNCAVAPAVTRSTSFPYYSDAYGASSGFAVTLWDGPKYTFNRLYETYPCPGGGSSMLAAVAQTEETEGLPTEPGTAATTDESPLPVEPAPSAAGPSWDPDMDPSMLLPLPELVSFIVSRTTFEAQAGDDLLTMEADALMASATSTDLSALSTTVHSVNGFPTYPRMAGFATMANSGNLCGIQGNFDVGGGWMVYYYEKMQVELLQGRFYGIDYNGNRVGQFYNRAWYLPAVGGSGSELMAITPGYGGTAWSLSPDGTKIAGASARVVAGTGYFRPTVWIWPSGTTYDLGSFDGTSTTAQGAAMMVNDAGVVVGKSKSGSSFRAFRDTSYSNSILDTQLPFASHTEPRNVTLNESVAYGVDSAGNVVGTSDTAVERDGWKSYKKEKRATLWWAGSNTAVPLGTVYPIAPNSPWADPEASEAYAATQVGAQTVVVGTSWTTPPNYPDPALYVVAFLVPNVPTGANADTLRTDINMLNLNDAHLTYFPPSWNRNQWSLKSAKSINSQGVIVGNGAFGTDPLSATAQQLAWILIPQTEAQP